MSSSCRNHAILANCQHLEKIQPLRVVLSELPIFSGFYFLDDSFSAALDGRNKRSFYILVVHLTTLGRKGNERSARVTLHNERTSMHNQVHVDVTVFLCRVAFIVSVSTDLHG